MKTLSFTAALALVLTLAHISCNPDCESLQGVKLSTDKTLEGYEVSIDATPRDALKDKKVFFGKTPAETRYHESIGLIVKVPSGISPNTELRIEDPDCSDVFAFPFQVVTQDYFSTIDNFVPPLPPEVVIPYVPIVFPPSVDNAWLSPDNPGYCLWFTMYRDIKPNGDTVITNLIDPNNSFEQATCCCLRGSNLPYAQNRMGGIIDVKNNRIEVYIDRTERGGDIEEFSGYFIDRDQIPQYADNTGLLSCPDGGATDPNCAGGNNCVGQTNVSPPPVKNHMMLLNSLKTGRQLVAYQLRLQ